ncbi:hypothetical protein C4D60_Mb11t19590 [Musa balbisiana]|uniref:Uncharacterized protein n=1 Tax=Musa balbisiana TaxID=52838 RepID=A0A4S8J7T2_MUSBA|nr:hypothetical protein C4D60_Mb11t19590 [Musa balbisiana]
MGGDLYALDFDGAAKIRWPWLFGQVDSAMETWIIDQMYILRPVVETGYENLLLVRLLVELQVPSVRKSSVADGLTVEAILENWWQLKPIIMKEWDEERDALIDLFGRVRDEWIDNDLSGWIGANRFYPGVADALRFASSQLYIVTTKQVPTQGNHDIHKPKSSSHFLSLASFVEDRLATLKNVIKEPALAGWNLYLGRWGYNTEKERAEAESIPRIQLLDLSDFSKKLK